MAKDIDILSKLLDPSSQASDFDKTLDEFKKQFNLQIKSTKEYYNTREKLEKRYEETIKKQEHRLKRLREDAEFEQTKFINEKAKEEFKIQLALIRKIEDEKEKSLKSIANIEKKFFKREESGKAIGGAASTLLATISPTLGKASDSLGDSIGKISTAFGKSKLAGTLLIVNSVLSVSISLTKSVIDITKRLADQLGKLVKSAFDASKAFVSSSSLLTDKTTIENMQRYGLSAEGAQSAQRSVETLGISLEDIQSGKVTAAQMKAFEEIRQHELDKLKEISSKGREVFDGLQKSFISLKLIKRDISDMFLTALVSSDGMKRVLETLNGIMPKIQSAIERLTPALIPIIDAIADSVNEMIPIVLDIVENVVPIISGFLVDLAPVLKELMSVVITMLPSVSKLVEILMRFVIPILKILNPILMAIGKAFEWLVNILDFFTQGLAQRNIITSPATGTTNVNTTTYATTNNYGSSSIQGNTLAPSYNTDQLALSLVM